MNEPGLNQNHEVMPPQAVAVTIEYRSLSPDMIQSKFALG